ncbi:MAG: DUF4350 domain-containing protein [Planctomycetales bacterium]
MTTDDVPESGAAPRSWPWQTGLWLAALMVVLSLHVWFPRIDAAALNDTYSADLGGRNAFYQYAQRHWSRVERNLDPLPRGIARIDRNGTLCLLGPARDPTPREWEAVLRFVARGGNLLVAARWDEPDVELPGLSVRVTLPSQSTPVEKVVVPPTGESRPAPPDLPMPLDGPEAPLSSPSDQGQTPPAAAPTLPSTVITSLVPAHLVRWQSKGIVVAPSYTSLVRTLAGEQAVRLRHGLGTIVLCASDQIFSNTALFDRKHQNGLLAIKLLETAGVQGAIVFDESLNATGTPKVVGLLLAPFIRPLTLQALALLILFGWRGGRRFGGVLPEEHRTRRNLTDHSDALGNLYYKTRHGAGALKAYLDQLRRQLRLSSNASRDPRTLAPLAQRTGLDAESIQRVLLHAEASLKRDSLKRREAASIIRELAKLRKRP